MTSAAAPPGLAGWGAVRSPSTHDLATAISSDLGVGRREVEARGLCISATFDFSGWRGRTGVFHPHGLDAHGEGALDTLLAHLVAQERHAAGNGSPTSHALQAPSVTRALGGTWLETAIAQVWRCAVETDHARDPDKAGALTWRTAGPVPACAGKLIKGKYGEALRIDMPDGAPWMLGIVSAHHFQIHVLGDIRGTMAMRTSGRAEVIMAGVPETMADSLVGRRLADVIGMEGLADADLRLGKRRMREGAYALEGAGLLQPLPTTLRTPDADEMARAAARLPTALPLAAAIRERHAGLARGR